MNYNLDSQKCFQQKKRGKHKENVLEKKKKKLLLDNKSIIQQPKKKKEKKMRVKKSINEHVNSMWH